MFGSPIGARRMPETKRHLGPSNGRPIDQIGVKRGEVNLACDPGIIYSAIPEENDYIEGQSPTSLAIMQRRRKDNIKRKTLGSTCKSTVLER